MMVYYKRLCCANADCLAAAQLAVLSQADINLYIILGHRRRAREKFSLFKKQLDAHTHAFYLLTMQKRRPLINSNLILC
jgi:hypothetical protein